MVYKTTSFSPMMTFGFSLLMILSGCGRSELKTHSFGKGQKTIAFTSSDRSINGRYAVFNTKASKTYLGRDVIKRGYQPIYMNITNNSDRSIYVSPDSISLPTVPADKVSHAVHTSTAGRAVGLGTPGVLGAACFTTYGILVATFLGFGPVAIVAGAVAGTACIAPAVITSVNSAKTNEDIDITFEELSLKPQLLAPGHSTNGIVFVRKKTFKSDFKVTMTDASNTTILLQS